MRHLVLITLVTLTSTLAIGQALTTGQIAGRVVDATGQPLAEARVSLVSSALQGERVIHTNAKGEFFAGLLPVGPYAVTVSAPGKRSVQVSLRVQVGQTDPLRITLEDGEQQVEEVTVYASPTPLETTIIGENFNYNNQVEERPIARRDIGDVARYAPNVQDSPEGPATDFYDAVALSGAPSTDTIVLLDGAEISDPYFGGGLPLYLEDALEEVQVLTTGVPARYGRFQGGVINAVTKSGSNTFNGAFRAEFWNQSWNSTTPFGEEQSNDLNQTYQATLGGYMLTDKLWFFVGGRTTPTQTLSRTTVETTEAFEVTIEEDRWQAKLRGAPTTNHVIEASYLDYQRTGLGAEVGTPGDLGAAVNSYRSDPRRLFTISYQAVLDPTTFLDVRATRRDVSLLVGGDPAGGDPFGDLSNGFSYRNAGWDRSDEQVRDNDSLGISFTWVLATDRGGNHTLESGVQLVRSTTAGNNSQSPTGLRLLAFPQGTTPFAVPGSSSADMRFNLNNALAGGDMLVGRQEDLSVQGEQILDNYAVYAQDSWRLGKWRVDAGLRWEAYDGSAPNPDLRLSMDALAPRLGLTRTINSRWQVQATWGRYVARLNDGFMKKASLVQAAPWIRRLYTGPPLLNLTGDEAEAILRDDSQWGLVFDIRDPDQPVIFLADDAEPPHVDELTVGVRAALPRSSGSVTVTYVDRDYEDLLDDFVGDFGSQLLHDPVTGQPQITPSDNVLWNNAGKATRKYRALVTTWDYRPGARWDLGGNWTLSELTGNYEGEQPFGPQIGSAIGRYERSRPEENAVPWGYLNGDVRHRFQIWSNYRFDVGRAGAVSLGAIGRYSSGRNWNRTDQVPLADDPLGIYNIPFGLIYTHHFDGRGQNRFDDWWSVDFSARWQFRIVKRLDAWLKATVLNLFNNDALVRYDTSGASQQVDGSLVWEPLGNCGPGDPPSTECSAFGAIRSQDDYQAPRGYLFTLGLAF